MEALTTPPPDGGWGWMVVLGAALINMVNQAMFTNFGLVFSEKLESLAGRKATGITIVMAVNVMVTNFSGLTVGPLMKKFSVQTLAIFSILCVGSGMIMSSFSEEIWQIIIGYGVFTGLGLGLLASLTFLAISDYFTEKKSTAVGLSMAGTSLGQMIMPIFIGILLNKYKYSGTTLILGLLNYTGIIGALFFKPLFCCKKSEVKEDRVPVENGTKIPEVDVNCNDGLKNGKKEDSKPPEDESVLIEDGKVVRKKRRLSLISNGMNAHYRDSAVAIASSMDLPTPRPQEPKESIITKIIKFLDLTLLVDPIFDHILIGLGLGYLSTVSFSTFFPIFLREEVNFTMLEVTTCMTALSFADIFGRITVPEICRRMHLGNRSAFMMGCVLLAITRSCLVELSGFKFVFAASLLIGYFRAATVINQNLVISEYIQKDKLPSAVGLNMVSKGVFVMVFGQLLGITKDEFSYRVCIHLLNIVLMLVVTSWTLELVIRGRKKLQQDM